MFEGLSASAMKPACEGPASTYFSGAVSQYVASEVVLWRRSCRLKRITEMVQVNFFLLRNMLIPAVNSHVLALKMILSKTAESPVNGHK